MVVLGRVEGKGMTVGIKGREVGDGVVDREVGTRGVSVVRGVLGVDGEAVREERSMVMVVEAAPDSAGVGVLAKVGRIIELVLLSVNLGIETEDEVDSIEDGVEIRLPAVGIEDVIGVGSGDDELAMVLVDLLKVIKTEELEVSSCPSTLVPLVDAGGTICVGLSVTGSRSDAGPVKLLVGEGAGRREEDVVGVSRGVEDERGGDDVEVVEGVNVKRGNGIEELGLEELSGEVV